MTGLLAPNERLTGTPQQRLDLDQRLTAMRATPDLTSAHPELTCVRLSDLISARPATPGLRLLHAGIGAAQARLAEVGLTSLLPPERVWVGVGSREPGTFGGFHYPDQGYRHWQMAAFITRYGDLARPQAGLSPLAALDLIRAYAHDSLHYGCYRAYQATPGPDGHGIERVRYGINFRRLDGRSYSAPDPPGSSTTRNLGIIMESVTDKEARAITSQAASQAGLLEPPANPERLGYRDVTGHLGAADCELIEAGARAAPPSPASAAAYLARMARYQRATADRYETFLTELSPSSPQDLHTLIITATITGSLIQLTSWLDHHHGPAAFPRFFKAPPYTRRAVSAALPAGQLPDSG